MKADAKVQLISLLPNFSTRFFQRKIKKKWQKKEKNTLKGCEYEANKTLTLKKHQLEYDNAKYDYKSFTREIYFQHPTLNNYN